MEYQITKRILNNGKETFLLYERRLEIVSVFGKKKYRYYSIYKNDDTSSMRNAYHNTRAEVLTTIDIHFGKLLKEETIEIIIK